MRSVLSMQNSFARPADYATLPRKEIETKNGENARPNFQERGQPVRAWRAETPIYADKLSALLCPLNLFFWAPAHRKAFPSSATNTRPSSSPTQKIIARVLPF